MFAKMLFSGKPLYFRYAPPLTDLDEISDDELPNRPYQQAKPYERSVYFYWWAFLRENEAYLARCEAGGEGPMSDLYADFGDVRDGSFMGWWTSGKRMLFCEPEEAEIVSYLSPPTEPIGDERVLVSIPVTGDLDRTMAELRKMLKRAFDHERRQRSQIDATAHAYSRAKYPVFMKPVLTALHDRLIIYQARKQHPDASLYDIGLEAGLAERTSGEKGDADHRNRVRAAVGRALSEAKALVHNVGEGRFPDISPPPKP
jgi:hypothetical protein